MGQLRTGDWASELTVAVTSFTFVVLQTVLVFFINPYSHPRKEAVRSLFYRWGLSCDVPLVH